MLLRINPQTHSAARISGQHLKDFGLDVGKLALFVYGFAKSNQDNLRRNDA